MAKKTPKSARPKTDEIKLFRGWCELSPGDPYEFFTFATDKASARKKMLAHAETTWPDEPDVARALKTTLTIEVIRAGVLDREAIS